MKRVHYVLGEGRSGRKLGLNVASGYVVPGLLGREVEGGGGKTVVLWNHARRERQELLELLLLYIGQCYWSQVNKVLSLLMLQLLFWWQPFAMILSIAFPIRTVREKQII